MNYYEELGVSQEATGQEIRKAHRRLVKLMHPDAQPDPNLKMLAETQMRRLNSIVSTLLDAEQRRAYDEQLLASKLSYEQTPPRPSWAGIPWWFASAVGAVVLTLLAVWLWADHLGSTFGARANRTLSINPAESRPALAPPLTASADLSPDNGKGGAAYTPAPQFPPSTNSAPSPSNGISATVLSDRPNKPSSKALKPETSKTPIQQTPVKESKTKPTVVAAKSKAPQPVPAQPKSSNTKNLMAQNRAAQTPPRPIPETKPKKVFSLPSTMLVASAAPLWNDGAKMPTPPGVAAMPSRDYNPALPATSLPAPAPPRTVDATTSGASPAGALASNSSQNRAVSADRDPLEGEWVYAPKEPERHRAGFYPPEYIDLKLFGSGDPGNLKGQYNAKYVVTDRPVSSEVAFQLASTSRGSRKFVWQSSSGAKGTLSIDPIDDRTIRIDWHTTSAIREPALTSGQATLIRRQ